jgi:predicted TIM-barrel fold metal-dependent hydrolase
LALGLIPETGLDDALAELRYCALGGLKGICLNGWPCGRSYPTEEDDVFWQEAMNLGLAVTVHIQLRYRDATDGPAYPYPKVPTPDIHPQATDPLRHLAAFDRRGGLNALQLAFAGTFDRLPDFRIFFAETYVGWLPIFFEQVDMLYDRTIHWANEYVGLPILDHNPSEYLRRHIYWGFVNDPFGVKVRDDVGIDRAMWSSDFPHSVTTWPESSAAIDAMFAGVPPEEKAKMVCNNAMDFFGLSV